MHYLLKLKDYALTEPEDCDSFEIVPIGKITVKYDAIEEREILGTKFSASPERQKEKYLFEALIPIEIETKLISQLLVLPETFVNNPKWSTDDLLDSSGPVFVEFIEPKFHKEPGQIVLQEELLSNGGGYLKCEK